jgi:hypothetical protein
MRKKNRTVLLQKRKEERKKEIKNVQTREKSKTDNSLLL